MYDVARHAGVSQATVSFVLNPRLRVKVADSTARRVIDAINELGYRPNRLAQGLRSGRSMTVGMLICYMDDIFTGVIARACQDRLYQAGYQLLFGMATSGSEQETSMVKFLYEHRVDAIACFADDYATFVIPEWLEGISEAGIPGVMVDGTRFSDVIDSVGSDDIAGMRSAVNHLHGLGHTRICLVSQNWRPELIPDRIIGYDKALADLGLTYNVKIGAKSPVNKDETAAEMARLLDMPDGPTAFVTYSDYAFEGFLMNYVGTRFRVPDDVSLIGYGNLYLSRVMRMTSIDQRPAQIGKAVAECILSRIEQPDLLPRKVEIGTDLIVRSSTGRPRPA